MAQGAGERQAGRGKGQKKRDAPKDWIGAERVAAVPVGGTNMEVFRRAGRGDHLQIQKIMQQKNFCKDASWQEISLSRQSVSRQWPAVCAGPVAGRVRGCGHPRSMPCAGPETKNAEAPGSFRKGDQRRGGWSRLSSRRSWTGTGLLSPWRGSGRGDTWGGGAGLPGWTLCGGGGGCR